MKEEVPLVVDPWVEAYEEVIHLASRSNISLDKARDPRWIRCHIYLISSDDREKVKKLIENIVLKGE